MKNDSVRALYEILDSRNVTDECRKAMLCIMGSNKSVDSLVIPDIFGGKEPQDDRAYGQDYSQTVKDYRIRSLEFRNFRCFFKERDDDASRYGIDFRRNGCPCSLFLVGGNGTGKSSLFAAIERFYTGTSTYADNLKVSESEYFRFGMGQIKCGDVDYRVCTGVDMTTKDENPTDKNDIMTKASFCTDVDMKQIEDRMENLYDYVLGQLGYDELVRLRDRLDYLSLNIKTEYLIDPKELTSSDWDEMINVFIEQYHNCDRNRIKKLSNDAGILESLSSGEEHKEFVGYWEMLRDGCSRPNPDFYFTYGIEQDKAKEIRDRLSRMYTELYSRLEEFAEEKRGVVDILDGMYSEKNAIFEKERRNSEIPLPSENRKAVLGMVTSLVKEKCDSIVQNTFSDSHGFIEYVMARFSPSNEKYSFRYDNGSLSLRINVSTSKGSFEAKPHAYLNTFRFKLFCLTLKIAIAFEKMKEKKIVVPIVIDDVLDASDFENTMKLEQFVYTVYRTYDEMLKYDKPLQIILLTHDEMVQNAFRQGVSLRSIDCEMDMEKPSYYGGDIFVCGRLFDMNECAEYLKDESTSGFVNLYINN